MDRLTTRRFGGHDEIPGAVSMLNGVDHDGWHPEIRLDRWFDPATGAQADAGRQQSDAEPAPDPEPDPEPVPEASQHPASGSDEVARLRDAIATAAKRAESARFRAESREAAARDTLHTELVATRQQIVEMDDRHHDEVAAIRAAAQADVQRIIDAAHQAVAELGGERTGER